MKNARWLKPSKWKVLALSVAALLGMGAIGIHRFPADPPDEDPDNSSYHLTKTVIPAGMRNMDKAFLSPDGSSLLIDRREIKPDLSETRWLEVHDVATFRTLATMPMPTVPPPPPSMPSKIRSVSAAVHFCNAGKTILVYESGYTFSIFDARTFRQKASITLRATTDRSAENPLPDDRPTVVLASGCAAGAPVAAVEIMFGPFGTGVTQVFDLDTGKQISEIAADAFGSPINIDVSPSGASAAILVARFQKAEVKPAYDTTKNTADLTILDLNARALGRRILSGVDGSRAAFVGENQVAVAGSGEPSMRQEGGSGTQGKLHAQLPGIQLFDIHTGTLSQRFGDPADGARVFVAASSDGRLLLGYTGKEWMYTEGGLETYLQVDRARFTIWDRQTGTVIAQSPGLQVFKRAYKMLDNSHTVSERPTMDYSQRGNAVLVSWPGFATKRVEIFTIK